MEGDSLDGTNGVWLDKEDNTINQYKEITMNEEREQEKEDNLNANDITSIEKVLDAMDEEEDKDEPNEIQDRDYLSKFLEKYIKIMEDESIENSFQNPLDFKKSLGVLLMRIFLEKIYNVYELNKSYDVEIQPIDLTADQAKGLLALIDELRPLIRDKLSEMYDDLPDNKEKPTDRKSISVEQLLSFFPEVDLTSEKKINAAKDMMLDIISQQRNTMLNRMHDFPNRFFTALFFKYVLGVDVMPGFTLNNLLQEKFKPWNSNYKNVVLFYGYSPSIPNTSVDRDADRFKYIIEILNTLKNDTNTLYEFCLRTVIEVIKGYKSGNTIQKNLEVNENAEVAMQLVSYISNMKEIEPELLKNKSDKDKKEWSNAINTINDLTAAHKDATKPIKNTKQLRLSTNITLENLYDFMRENNYTLALVPNEKVVTLTAPKKGEQTKFKIGLKGVEKN